MVKWSIWALLCIIVSDSPAQTLLKEFRSQIGVVRFFLPPQDLEKAGDSAASLFGDGDSSAIAASNRDSALSGETLLMVSFQDALSGEEVRFPVRVSQVKRFLRSQPKRDRAASREETWVAGIRELSVALKVRMRKNREPEDSK